MRSSLLPIATLLLSTAPASAQLHAGEVPAGMSALDLNVHIAASENLTIDSAALELDCDDSFDGWAGLIRGYPAVDAPHSALLRLVDSDMEVCADQGAGFARRPKYYASGEVLECSGSYSWQSAWPLTLGDFGGFSGTGPSVVDSLYIAYRNASASGWMQISFDLSDDAEIDLYVHQVLPLCPSTTAITTNELPAVGLFPNPSDGGPIRVQCADALRSIDVLDASGRSIAQYNGTPRMIATPEVAGTYLVRALHADGRRTVTRLVRY